MGMYDGLQEIPSLTAQPPKAPPSMYEGLDVLSNKPRAAVGLVENITAGLQASVPVLAYRKKLPELFMDPEHSKWWERLAGGLAQVVPDLSIMIPGGMVGAAAGSSAGPVGTILGGGAGAFGPVDALRAGLMESYRAGDAATGPDFWSILRESAMGFAKGSAIGAATMGTGAVARAGAGAVLAGTEVGAAVGLGTASVANRAGALATKGVDVATQIATMTAMPGLFVEGPYRWPDAREYADGATVILSLIGGHAVVNKALQYRTQKRMEDIYVKIGKTPSDIVADAKADPKLAEDLTRQDDPIPTFRDQLTKQEELWTIQDRLGLLDRQQPESLTPVERTEADTLRAKVAALEAEGVKPEQPVVSRETPPEPGPRFAPDQLTEAKDRAAARIAELTTKEGTGPLTDVERAERIGLVNSLANPEALAKRYGIEPAIKVPTAEEREASAKTVYDDVYRQLTEADQARQASGIATLGDAHARTVAEVISREARTYGEALGRMPEDVYKERYLTVRDNSAAAVEEAAAAIPPEAPRFTPPEVDLFGNPIAPETVPRAGVADLATQEVPIAGLKLSKEVPQFKKDANAEGVIVPLGGKFDRTGVGPIQVWERLDGSMEVISGRHRLDLARRSGEETIPAQIHREADGFTAKQAATLDAQLNIREEQGSGADFAQYFRDSGISEQTANELGLLARAKGRGGFAIARDASPDLLAAHRAGLLSDDAALVISGTAPGSERLQALGIAMVNDGKSTLYAANMMRSVDLMASERMAAGAQGDIFGFDDSAMREAAAMAKKASSKQRAISEQISAVSGASRRPELARKMGVDVQDPEGIQKKIAELKQEQYQWDNWPLYPELVAKLRGQELHQTRRSKFERTPAGPVLRAADIDIADPFFQYAVEGVEIHRHSIATPDGKAAGEMAIGWRGDQIIELVNIVAEPQLAGIGERVIRAILSHNNPDTKLLVSNIQPEARAFWEKMGAQLLEREGQTDGLITRETYNFARPVSKIGTDLRTSEGTAGLSGDAAGQDTRGTEGDAGGKKGGTLYQDDFELKPETPAELKARDEEAAAAAKRKLAQERAGVKGPVPTVDQADLFNTQRTLFSPDKGYTVGHEVRQTEGRADAGQGKTPDGQIDLFAPAEIPGSPVQTLEKIVVEPQQVGKHKIPVNRVRTADDAAAVFQHLNKSPMEKFQVLGLDAKGKPIAFFDMFAGTTTQTSVFPREVWTAVYQTPGIKSVWIAHQHPSGLATPSAADQYLTKSLQAVLTPDIGITLRGHLIVTKNKTIDIGPDGQSYGGQSITPTAGEPKHTVPIMERTITKQDDVADSLSSPAAVRDFFRTFKPTETGLLVMDAQHRATGWWPMTVEQMAKLRTGDVDTGMAALMRSVGKGNPAAAIAYSPEAAGARFESAVQNIGNALGLADVKMLDAIVRESDSKMISLAETGKPLTTGTGVFFQKPGQERDGQHLGSYSVADRIVTLFENANKTTVIHEVGHHFLENLKHFASQPGAPQRIKDMWATARQEFAIGADGEISTASHEMNARSFERYLGEGIAPSVGLRAVFAQFRTWMLEIYGNLQNLGVNINPEVRALFDKMLATDQEIADAKALDVPRAYVPEARAAEAEKIVPSEPPPKKQPEPGFKDEQLALDPFAKKLLEGPGSGPTEDSRVNAKYINAPEHVKLAIQRVAEIDQQGIQAARGGEGGVKSWEQANAEADAYITETMGGKMAMPGAGGIPHDILQRAAFKVMMSVAKYSLELRDVILKKGDNATIQDQFDYLNSIVRMRMTQAEFLGLRAASARAMNQIRDMTPDSGVVDKMVEATSGRQLFQSAKTDAEIAAELKMKLQEIMAQHFSGKSAVDIAKLHKDVKDLQGGLKFAKGVTEATKWEMVVEGWKAGLLSGPVTHTTNLFGTGAFQVLRAPVDALAATIGMARGASPGMGESDRASMSEAVARITGMLGGVQDGLKVAAATFRLDDPTGKTEAYRTAIPGRAGEIIRIPLRLMGAEDALVTTMYMRGELKTLAIRQAFDENLNPSTREFAQRVQHLVDNPTPDIQARAEAAATRMTFNMPLGEKGVALQLFVNKWNLQWMIPFIRTPINIAKELLRMSPFAPAVGEWRAAIRQGGVERDRALAEIALGTGITALTMAYAFAGNISGAGSPDPGKNRGKAGVWQPYSILIGDTWYEYARIQPTGTLMGMAADIAQIWDHMTEEEKDKVPKMLAGAFAQAITNQTFLQGITNFVNAMSDPARFGPRFLQQFAGSMVPNIIGQPTAMADPYVREVNGMIEAIQARLPGRQDLLPKRDWLGAPVETKERVGVVLPSRTLKVSEDKVRLEAERLELSMAAAPKKTHIGKGTGKLGDVELTPEERNKFAQVGGEMAHKILTNIVNAPGYDAIPDLVKRKIFAKVLQASHQVAAVQAMPMDKRLGYLQSISEKVAAELAPEPQ